MGTPVTPKRQHTGPRRGAGRHRRSSTRYPGFADNLARSIGSSRTDCTASPSFEEPAAQQGVVPIDDIEALLGKPLSEDESAEEFAASLREWRREAPRPGIPL